ncbi:MAG: HEAT repeat domain-containing protein [Planctomycetota bacterium]
MPLGRTVSFSSLFVVASLGAQRIEEPSSAKAESAFAIVVDDETWAAIPDAIRRYRDATETDGLATSIVVDDRHDPVALRQALRSLHQGVPSLEGAILVGAIPVPMLRGAQHLTTSFKLDEDRYPARRSSVPTDCTYEDFDLRVEPAGRDEQQALLHYFTLSPESVQLVQREIYTARLFPPAEGRAGMEAMARCLDRFVRARTETRSLDRVLTLMGHGYVSESLDAWADDRQLLREVLPNLSRPGGALVSLHHERGPTLEAILRRELSDSDLDLAILHSHGDDDREYLLGAPSLPTTQAQVDEVRRYLRARLRRARARGQSEADVQRELRERLGVPDSWFAGAFDDAVTRADATADALKEWAADEVATLACGARVVDLDACFNGNFTVRPWQAGAYLYGSGATVAVVANTVNVAQDVWGDRGLCHLALGQRLGAWHKARPHIESHLFGDPTFRFARQRDVDAADRQFATATWAEPGGGDERLLTVLREASVAVVRREALAGLARHRGPQLPEALLLAACDPCESIRRSAVDLMGDVGDAEFIARLVRAALRDPSERVAFRARESLGKYEPQAVAGAFARVAAELPIVGDQALALRGMQTPGFIAEYRTNAKDRALPSAKRMTAIRTFRLYRVHAVVDDLLALAQATDDEPAVRRAALEALGWFVYSARRSDIEAVAARLAGDTSIPPEISREALKTVRRLQAGANDPLLP